MACAATPRALPLPWCVSADTSEPDCRADVKLYLDSPYYGAYPFDQHALTVELQSRTLTANRMAIVAIDELSGFEGINVHSWPGWTPSQNPVFEGSAPGVSAIWAAGTGLTPRWPTTQLVKNLLYPHSVQCTQDGDARSAFVLSLAIVRKYDEVLFGSIIPLGMLVCISWASFFMNVKDLMPRVAVGFISFLTLSNWAIVLSSNLPHLAYTPWIEVLIQTCRQSIFVSLVETALASFTMENCSLHVSRLLDKFSRVVIPANFVLMWAYNFAVVTSDTGYIFGSEVNNHQAFDGRLQALNIVTWVDMGLLLVAGTACVVLSVR